MEPTIAICIAAPRSYVDKILKGRQARRSARGAAEEVRVRHQSQNRQADRPDDSAECAGAGGQGNSMKVVSGQESVMISPLCIFRRGGAASEDHRVGILVLAKRFELLLSEPSVG